MIVWRLTCDHENLLSGSCVSEQAYKNMFYSNRPLYEPITDDDRKIMIEVKNKRYCDKHNLECILFWSEIGSKIFNEKVKEWITYY